MVNILQTSVIIPHYNRSDIVIDAIKSCLEQTIPPNEIIIVDDNSSNDELIKLKSNIKLLSNNTIKIIELKKNNGPSHCRNHGVNSSNFNVIFFLDTDDLWLDNKIEKSKTVKL